MEDRLDDFAAKFAPDGGCIASAKSRFVRLSTTVVPLVLNGVCLPIGSARIPQVWAGCVAFMTMSYVMLVAPRASIRREVGCGISPHIGHSASNVFSPLVEVCRPTYWVLSLASHLLYGTSHSLVLSSVLLFWSS